MSDVGRAATRGVIAAMAMTGMRKVTTGIGLMERTPPQRIAKEGVPGLLGVVPPAYREEAIELAHWSYGAGAGVAFGLLPRRVRESPWGGPLYGLAILLVFEAFMRRAFGLQKPRRKPLERLALTADHLLYGLALGGRPRRD